MKPVSHVFSIITFLLLSGCQTIETRGQFIDDNLIRELTSKKPIKPEIVDLIGTPTLVPTYSSNTWYYIARTMSQRAWLTPKVIEQRIIKVTFNNNIIQEIVVIDDTHREGIEIIQECTKTYGTELSGLQKFIKNFGRFNQATKDSKKTNKKKR